MGRRGTRCRRAVSGRSIGSRLVEIAGTRGPPGMPVVGCCRRGTWSCPGMLSEHPGSSLEYIPRPRGSGVHSAPNQIRTRLCECRGAPATKPKSTCAALPPRICRQPKARSVRPRRRDYATASARGPADPVPSTRAPKPPGGREHRAACPAPSLATASGGPPAPPSFGKRQMPQHLCRLQAEWRHGVGRHARQMRGDIMRTCKNLRVRRRSQRVQTGMYRCLYRFAATFLSLLRRIRHTDCVWKLYKNI